MEAIRRNLSPSSHRQRRRGSDRKSSSSASSSSRRQRIPRNVQCNDPGLTRQYFTRRHSSQLSTNDLPMELNAIGFNSPWAFLWYCLFLVAPLAYIYIGLMLLRDLCENFPLSVQQPLQHYVPWLATIARLMKSYYGFRLVDVWCVIEALFYVACKLKIRYLQSRDPLEASLSAAPMLDSEERKSLWDHMMEVDSDLTWVTGWFLDHPDSIEAISRYDIFDFVCWAMFDGRNQEHLTTQELQDLESFIEDMEYRISLMLYGVIDDDERDGSVGPLVIVQEEDEEEEAIETEEDAKAGDPKEYHGDDIDNDDDSTLPRRGRTSSSNLSTMCQPARNDSDQNLYSDEFRMSTPSRSARRSDIVPEDDNTLGSGSDNWSSVASSRKPRPKKCMLSFCCMLTKWSL
jgi:hypothetical protein